MRFTTTDGKIEYRPDELHCCRINTAGEHEANCPNYRQNIKVFRYSAENQGTHLGPRKEIKE